MRFDHHPDLWLRRASRPIVICIIAAGLSLAGCAGPLDDDDAGPLGLPQVLPRVTAVAPPSSTVSPPPVEGPLNLDTCLKLALAQNPGLKAQADEAGRAGAEAALARSQRWPRLDAVSGYTHSLDVQRLVPARYNGENGAFSRDMLSSDLVLSMPLFTGGQITHKIKAGELLQAAAGHRLARSQDELIYNVTSIFYHILSQQRFIESITFSQRAMEEQHQRTKQLIDAQKAAGVDLLRIDVRLANIRQQLIQERNVLAIQRRSLGVMLGLTGQSIQIAGELDAQAFTLGNPSPTAEVLNRRADYLAAMADVEAERHRLEAAQGARWPQVSARASYGGRYGIDADTAGGADDLEDVASIGIFGTLPLFDGGQIASDVLRERFALSASRQRQRDLALRIDLEIETARLNIQSAAQVVQFDRITRGHHADGAADGRKLGAGDLHRGLVGVVQVQTGPEDAALVLTLHDLEGQLEVVADAALGRLHFRGDDRGEVLACRDRLEGDGGIDVVGVEAQISHQCDAARRVSRCPPAPAATRSPRSMPSSTTANPLARPSWTCRTPLAASGPNCPRTFWNPESTRSRMQSGHC